MYDLVHKHKRIVQVFLALIILPFAFVGVESYMNPRGNNDVATVGGSQITDMEFEAALRSQQERMRAMLGQNYDSALFDNPEVRQQILDELINQRVVVEAGDKLNLTAPDEQLRQVILEVPDFQVDGQFSQERYDDVLRANGMNRQIYEHNLRISLARQPMQDPLHRSEFVSAAQVDLFQRLTEQAREVQFAVVEPASFLSQVRITDEQIKAEYDRNPDAYRTQEQVKLEYVELSQAAVLGATAVSPEEVKAAYDERQASYTTPEERRASHILLTFDGNDSAAKAAAKAEAEAIVKEVGSSPEQFAATAKARSKDPGSAEQGGDLGLFGRGQMVKPFEDAVFSMKVGDVSEPVESDFGYHVIRLTEIKEAHVRPFDDGKDQIERELKQQRASRAFHEAAEKFQNRVYEQSESFQGVADELKLEVKTTDWLSRAQLLALGKGNTRFVDLVFSPATIGSKRNTEAMDLGEDNLISVRVLEHKPSAVKPLDEVKAEIETHLKNREAAAMAVKTGEERLAQVKSGNNAGLNFSPTQKLLRQTALPQINAELNKAVFATPPEVSDAVVGGVNATGGYTIVKVGKLVEPEALTDDLRRNKAQQLLAQERADVTNAYLGALKERIKVEIKRSVNAGTSTAPDGNG